MKYPPRIAKQLPVHVRKPDEGDNPRHRAWIRACRCLVNNEDCAGVVDPHHVRCASNAGMAKRPADRFCVPLCRRHHNEGEGILRTDWGWEHFERKYELDLLAEAAKLWKRSPWGERRSANE